MFFRADRRILFIFRCFGFILLFHNRSKIKRSARISTRVVLSQRKELMLFVILSASHCRILQFMTQVYFLTQNSHRKRWLFLYIKDIRQVLHSLQLQTHLSLSFHHTVSWGRKDIRQQIPCVQGLLSLQELLCNSSSLQ